MKEYVQVLILLAAASAVAISCSPVSLVAEHRLESCSEMEADNVLIVDWSIPELGIAQTNKLGFRWTDSKDHILKSRSQAGRLQDWHGSGMVGWSLSPLVVTNGVRLSLACRWRDSEVSGSRATSFLIPLDGDLVGEQEGFVLKTKWIQKTLPNQQVHGTQ